MSQQSLSVRERSSSSRPPRILVVDEDPVLTRVMTIALTLEGWDVEVASSGEDALDRAGSFHPNGILLDISLPDITGPTVVGALRARGDETPVVFVTGRDTLEDRLEAFGAGGDDYLTKPFALEEMVTRMTKALGIPPALPSSERHDLRGEGLPLTDKGLRAEHSRKGEPLGIR